MKVRMERLFSVLRIRIRIQPVAEYGSNPDLDPDPKRCFFRAALRLLSSRRFCLYLGPQPSTLYFCAGFDREGKRVVRVQNPRSAFFCKDPLLADYLSLRATGS